jgi:phosphoribosylformylglycinamidine cyclo-ligase
VVFVDYRAAGVNIAEAEKLVQWLKQKKSSSPLHSRVVSGIGSYSGLFQAVFPNMKEPCLAASTDGVGTKLKLAVHFQRYEEVGQDLVAMCVNDLICCGAKPLFFMDYYACSQLHQKQVRQFLDGVHNACERSQCILLGGETAEMPDCYTGFHFDCAGFAVGVVDRAKILGSHKVQVGDRLIGVSSSGFHSNGFSLLRKVFQKDLHKWEKELLTPTALYVSLALELFKIEGLRAIAHITGGGMDNLLRVLPDRTQVEMNLWNIPDPFIEVKERTGMKWVEMLKTLNCGLGLVLIVSPSSFKQVQKQVKLKGFSVMDLGSVKSQKEQASSWHIS